MRVHRSALRVHVALAGVLLVPALLLTGCTGTQDTDGSASRGGSKAEAKADVEDGAPGGTGGKSKGASAPRLTASHVIRTASLTVQVKDVPKALDRTRGTVEAADGYIGKETTTRNEKGRERTRVVLRVPVGKYEKVLDDLEGTGRLVDRDTKAKDVTEQAVDVESRIKTQRASVARIRELMDDATKLGDVVKLEGELSSRQADLESLLSRRASLKDRTDFATITLSLSEKPAGETDGDDPGFTDALAGGWNAFLTMLLWVAVALGAVLPFAAAAALLVTLWLRVARPWLRRRTTPETTTAPASAQTPDP
ncbi:DUF4349 domain-containing protein [Streptomyces iconiensis]|uniref:DUF4349 domain-containing protein n=1 Tax=Streptomyces iconiensis TaxID=1384038 RepID=A0ABT6ZSS0_9ACTN|nr:DUF4349 domain-containing protein [Streptomyces iconiensis]MDJ1132108.1 DUF4349 domain-containing protein [Streptomyces iconiensis]